MANVTLQTVYDQARGAYLNDTQVPGGETFTNTVLQPYLGEAYRRAYRAMAGTSKRVQRFVYVNLPATTTVLIPASYGMNDFAEPEIIEERPAIATAAITSTDTSTPIKVTFTAPHGLGPAATQGYGIVSGVSGTMSPWGQWGYTVIDASTISLNGSVSDGNAGTGGTFTAPSQQRFTEVIPADLAGQCIDGQQQQTLGCYLWENEEIIFRGAVNAVQLRITYWASGSPPTNPNQLLGIDDIEDFLACATAYAAAEAKGWPIAANFKARAFGPSSDDPEAIGGLLLEWLNLQVKTQQRGPQRRRGSYRIPRGRFGNYTFVG